MIYAGLVWEVSLLRERYIPPFIMLLAGAFVSIFNIIKKTEVLTALKQLLVALIIFYIIGHIVKAIYVAAIVKYAKKSEKQPDPNSDSSGTYEAFADEQGQENKQ